MSNSYRSMHFLSQHDKAISLFALAMFWVIGLLVGYIVATRISVSLLMRAFTLERVSIVGLVITTIFPLFISAAAIRYSWRFLIMPIAFAKAMLFSFCASALTLVYNDAGWLARWLYLFSDSIMSIFLLLFWSRNVLLGAETLKKDFATCTIAASFLICIDYFIVSPFSVMLFNYC